VAGVVRSFVVVGRIASASGEFLLDDLPGTSGRLDILVRCLRSGLLFSHGVRTDTVVYLVLPRGPRVVRFQGDRVRFLRPDERQLSVLLKKVLASGVDEGVAGFADVRRGISLARGGIDLVLEATQADRGAADVFILDERAPLDLRAVPGLGDGDTVFVLGDHLGLPEDICARLDAAGARRITIGPMSVHAEDAITVVANELDRRAAALDPAKLR
jgi:tRNA (pseudouridine54-N1)-methyltransferase